MLLAPLPTRVDEKLLGRARRGRVAQEHPRAEHLEELAGLLKAAGFGDDDPRDYTRYGSARELYHFKVDNTSAY